MKVALINGSPHKDGCTNLALEIVQKALNNNNIETDIIQMGSETIHSCIACESCRNTGHCVFKDDRVNDFIDQLDDYDGFVFGGPVYYGSVNSNLLNFMTRVFYAGINCGENFRENPLRLKPAVAVTSARRAGTMTSIDIINRFFSINEMPIISSTYWNEIHGQNKEDALKDKEALQTMKNLGDNMAYFLKLRELGKKEVIPEPEFNKVIYTNFIQPKE